MTRRQKLVRTALLVPLLLAAAGVVFAFARDDHAAAPHGVVAGATASAGHSALVPVQDSATSHAPVASRHCVVADLYEGSQTPVSGLQIDWFSQTSGAGHTTPAQKSVSALADI